MLRRQVRDGQRREGLGRRVFGTVASVVQVVEGAGLGGERGGAGVDRGRGGQRQCGGGEMEE